LRTLMWLDRSGKEGDHVGEAAEYGDFWPSPDGKRLVFSDQRVREAGPRKGDLWIRDLARGTTSRFTFDPANDTTPVWSPDGRRIAFTSTRKGKGDLYVKDASGTGQESVLLESPEEKYASDWSRDGKTLIFASLGTSWDVWALPLEGERKPYPLTSTPYVEFAGRLSPDGRLLAYHSNESGRDEVYVQEFPQAKSKWQVSTGGGTRPAWRSDGRELFYVARDSKLMAVPVRTTPSFSAGTPQPLFQVRVAPGPQMAHLRAAPDGQRFLALVPVTRDAVVPATIVLNWQAALTP
jgi:Tol biopolymer transport system component